MRVVLQVLLAQSQLFELLQHSLIPRVEVLQEVLDAGLLVPALGLDQVQLELAGEELLLVDVLVLCVDPKGLDAAHHVRCVVVQLSHQLQRTLHDGLPELLVLSMVQAVPDQPVDVVLNDLLLFLLVLPDPAVDPVLHLAVVDDLGEGEFAVQRLPFEGLLQFPRQPLDEHCQ